MKSVTDKMDSVEVGNGIDEAMRSGKAMRDVLLAEWEGLEKLSVEQQDSALARCFEVLELFSEIHALLLKRMHPLMLAHHKAKLLSRPPGDKLQ
jgi:hypothetical protein